MNNIDRRLRRLESAVVAPTPTIIVTDYPGETSAGAIARYRATHPGEPGGGEFIVFVSGFGRDPAA